MVLPRDALRKHAQHTADIVGSVYFQHHGKHRPNCLFRDPESQMVGFPEPSLIPYMLSDPGLWRCNSVGFGCTSISRRVFDSWDYEIPLFMTEREGTTETGHDLWFCSNAEKQGFEVWLDTSILCGHLTESPTTLADFMRVNDLMDKAAYDG
jgi:hypothetical protein